jgi:hypothetical protein
VLNEQGPGHHILSDALHYRSGVVKKRATEQVNILIINLSSTGLEAHDRNAILTTHCISEVYIYNYGTVVKTIKQHLPGPDSC